MIIEIRRAHTGLLWFNAMPTGDINVSLSVSGTVQTNNVTPSQPGGIPSPPGGVMPSGSPNVSSMSATSNTSTSLSQGQSPSQASGVPSGASSSASSNQMSGTLNQLWQDDSGFLNMSVLFQKLNSGLSQAANVASSALGGLAVAGLALKLQFDLMVGTAQAVDEWLNALARSAKRFSGEVAAATSLANVQDLLGDIRQGQTLGSDLAQYVSARSDLSATLKRIETMLASDVLPTAIEIVNVLGNASRGVERFYGIFSEGTGIRTWLPIVLSSWFQSSTVPGQLVGFFNLLELIANNTSPNPPAPPPVGPTQDFNNFINQVMQGFQAQQAGNQPFIIP